MTKIATWKLIVLFLYSCTVIPAFMFLLSLVVQWLTVSGNGVEFFGRSELYLAFKMAVVGFPLGILLWLYYYIPYRKSVLNK